MNIIKDKEFTGERPLFFQHDLRLENIKILNGESAIKEGKNIVVHYSYFNGKYPFWHICDFEIENCTFDTGARAAIWYSSNLKMSNCKIIAPKMFRRMKGIALCNVEFTDAQETLWDCENIALKDVKAVNGDYIFMNSSNIAVDNFNLQGNYSFQNCENITIKDSVLDSKDAFWEAENVIVENSVLNGEYLGWHSKNLKLVNCRISGTQPLCYAENLTLKNCTFDKDCDLAFEYSTVNATIISPVTSIKNPLSGTIKVQSVGTVIHDENAKAPDNCIIEEGYNGKS